MNTTWTGDRFPWHNPERGWACPVCGRGNAPHSNVCPCASSPIPILPAPWHPPTIPWRPEPSMPSTPWDPTCPDWTWRPDTTPWYNS